MTHHRGSMCAAWQGSALEDIAVFAAKDAFAGIAALSGSGGGSSNLTVIGARIGIDARETQPAPTLSNVRLYNQSCAAIIHTGINALTIAGAHIVVSEDAEPGAASIVAGNNGHRTDKATGAAWRGAPLLLPLRGSCAPILAPATFGQGSGSGPGALSIIDAVFEGPAAADGRHNRTAVLSEANIYMRRVAFSGFDVAAETRTFHAAESTSEMPPLSSEPSSSRLHLAPCDKSQQSQSWNISGANPSVLAAVYAAPVTLGATSADNCWLIWACKTAEDARISPDSGCKRLPKSPGPAKGASNICPWSGAWSFHPQDSSIVSAMDGKCLQLSPKDNTSVTVGTCAAGLESQIWHWSIDPVNRLTQIRMASNGATPLCIDGGSAPPRPRPAPPGPPSPPSPPQHHACGEVPCIVKSSMPTQGAAKRLRVEELSFAMPSSWNQGGLRYRNRSPQFVDGKVVTDAALTRVEAMKADTALDADAACDSHSWGDNALFPTHASKNAISAKSLGAVGDGIIDDTAALQAAVDQAASGGRVLFLPRGVYRTTTVRRSLPAGPILTEIYLRHACSDRN
jgi:hypothetical protein